MPTSSLSTNRSIAWLLAALVAVSCAFGPSCARKGKDADLKLKESICGFFLGETKKEVFRRAKGVAVITPCPGPEDEYRGELWNCSAPLEPRPGVDHVRLAFFQNRLWEIVVYFRDTSALNLAWLKQELEGKYQTHAAAPDGTIEMAYKTYRLSGPGMSITLRRFTKKEGTDLYVQYIHDELSRRFIEKSKSIEKK